MVAKPDTCSRHLSNATVREGTEPHRKAMGLLSRCCGVAATLSTLLTSSWRSSAGVVMRYVTPQTQFRLASSEVLERRAGAIELDELEGILLAHEQVIATHKIHIRYFMKYNYDIQNGSVPGGTTNNFPSESTTNHSGNPNTTNHSGTNNTIYQSGNSTIMVGKPNKFPKRVPFQSC